MKSIKFFFWDKYFLKDEIIIRLNEKSIGVDELDSKIVWYEICGSVYALLWTVMVSTGGILLPQYFKDNILISPYLFLMILLELNIRMKTTSRKYKIYTKIYKDRYGFIRHSIYHTGFLWW